MSSHASATAFGSWSSPISAQGLVSGAVGISELCVDGHDVWWAESRPDEGGRTAVMRLAGGLAGGAVTEITPADAYVRSLVHEYGGGAWWVERGVLFYVDVSDQRLRRLEPGGEPVLLTPAPEIARGLRYADGRVTPDGLWFVCVRECHRNDREPANELVAVATDGSGRVEVLWDRADFVMSPRVSPDGSKVAWVSWDHPNMPWDATTLRVHELVDGSLGPELVVVGNGAEAWCEPGWSADGRLLACTDRNDWWNLHEIALETGQLTPVVAGPFEIATPPWVFGMQRWAVSGPHTVAAVGLATGDELVIDGRTVSTPDATISSLQAIEDGVVFVGAGYGHEAEIVRLSLHDGSAHRSVVHSGRDLPVPAELLIEPESITFPTDPSAGPGAATSPVAHGLYYPPTNPNHVGPAGERPPLLVLAHGGPTAQARRQIQLAILYWTSRGIAVVDVDYRGSTGYGRPFRRALDGEWGVADVADCVAAGRYLAERGDVDADRLIIRGGSAGGFTVLSALAFHDVFAVGASRYGVADLQALATDTHKFESRYLDTMVGPWPEAKAVYEARSPINHVHRFSAPMIVLQGDEDPVVPPNQSEMIVAALVARGIPVAYLLFEGEQHGFRKAENVVCALEAELAFFGEILGFDPADELPTLEIRR